jgi:excisionase family DNA binding protein
MPPMSPAPTRRSRSSPPRDNDDFGAIVGLQKTLATLQTPEQRLVYTVAEAGELLGISRAFAYELVARGELPVICLGRRRIVPNPRYRRAARRSEASVDRSRRRQVRRALSRNP